MFGLFNSNNANATMPTSASIKEANEHMQAMLKRIWDLEQRVKEQTELMSRREAENSVRFQNMERQKELEMAGLQQDTVKVKERCTYLEGLLKERDVQIAYLFHRCKFLDEAASYVPLLDQLCQCLKTSSVAPPPKVHTVKPSRPNASANQDYTPDVPIAPSSEKCSQTVAADPIVKKHTKSSHYLQQYPEAVASVYAPNPTVALRK